MTYRLRKDDFLPPTKGKNNKDKYEAGLIKPLLTKLKARWETDFKPKKFQIKEPGYLETLWIYPGQLNPLCSKTKAQAGFTIGIDRKGEAPRFEVGLKVELYERQYVTTLHGRKSVDCSAESFQRDVDYSWNRIGHLLDTGAGREIFGKILEDDRHYDVVARGEDVDAYTLEGLRTFFSTPPSQTESYWFWVGKSFSVEEVLGWGDRAVEEIFDVYDGLSDLMDAIIEGVDSDRQPSPVATMGARDKEEKGMESSVKALLKQFGQVILYGPPGTGKTRLARQVALWLLEEPDHNQDKGAAQRSSKEVSRALSRYEESRRFGLVVFHPAYEYDQFVGGITARTEKGKVVYKTEPGVFLKLCQAAEKTQGSVVLVIDEINRGNLPKLLGELVMGLERDYRGAQIKLPFVLPDGQDTLVIPDNLYIIGTMNTADRSIGQIDVAIRRRFAFYPMQPNSEIVEESWKHVNEGYGKQLKRLMEKLNGLLKPQSGGAGVEEELGIGHSYFLPPSDAKTKKDAREHVERKWLYQVQPLLREYRVIAPGAESKLKRYDALKLDDALKLATGGGTTGGHGERS